MEDVLLEKVEKWLGIAEGVYLAMMLLFSIAISVSGVFFRYMLDSSLSWVEEAAGFIVVGIITVGASVSIRDNSHVSVEMLAHISSSTAKLLRIIAKVCVLVVMVLLFTLSSKFVWGLFLSGQKASALHWLYLGVPLVIMPLGYLVGVLHAVLSLVTFSDINAGEK